VAKFVHFILQQFLLFSPTFNPTPHDRLVSDHGERPGVIEYLQVLKLAAEVSVDAVELVLKDKLVVKGKWRAKDLRDALAPPVRKVIELPGLTPDLRAYDALLEQEVAHVG